MSCAFTGGPYHETTYLAATEHILIETLADCLDRSGWKMVDKVGAWAQSSAPTLPSDGTSITAGGDVFTFKTAPIGAFDVAIGASATDAANNLVAKVNSKSVLISMNYDAATTSIVATYKAGGTFGNEVPMFGWLDWIADLTRTNHGDKLTLGGYKFQTGKMAGKTTLDILPSVVYIYQTGAQPGFGAPTSRVQFMSADQTIAGTQHQIAAGPSASLKFVGGPAQFFLFRTDPAGMSGVFPNVVGAVVCGGSFYTNYDQTSPPANAWYSMGDYVGNPFFVGGTPRVNYGDVVGRGPGASECCYDRSYNPPGNSIGSTQVSLRLTPDSPGQWSGALQPHCRYGGDPIVSEPFLLSGDSPNCGYWKYRGQLYDCLTVGLPFAAGFTGTSLAAAYPWSDGSTLPDGTPKNRLSPDFDKAKWENITDNFPYGALFVVAGISDRQGKFNYAYEGKA